MEIIETPVSEPKIYHISNNMGPVHSGYPANGRFPMVACLYVVESFTSFFGEGAVPQRRFTPLYIGTNYINHQVIAAQITVGWERFGK